VAPLWSKTKQELFYALGQQIMVADYRVVGDAFQRDTPRSWSRPRFLLRGARTSYDLHPDGNRFALAVAPEVSESAKRDELVFVFNFFDELRRLVPVKN
jgi:hypothetical protein